MPTNHKAYEALPDSGSPDRALFRQAWIARTPYIVGDDETPTDLVAFDALSILWRGRMFYLDAADTTTAHDGVTCCVSYDGKRFKAADINGVQFSALDKDLTSPPSSPALGDQYIVPASPSGEWASQGKKIALWTARGWQYATPTVGMLVYVRDEATFYHYSASTTWDKGFGNNALTSGSVYPSHQTFPAGIVAENATTNTPPGTVTNGVCYIIGPSPTGAWVGHSNKLAIGEAGSWVVYTPSEGWRVFDKALGYQVSYKSGVWVVDRAAGIVRAVSYNGAATTGTMNQTSTVTLHTINLAVKKSTNVLFVDLTMVFSSSASNARFGLFRDTETNAREFFELSPALDGLTTIRFIHVPGDTSGHAYKIMCSSWASISASRATITEYEV